MVLTWHQLEMLFSFRELKCFILQHNGYLKLLSFNQQPLVFFIEETFVDCLLCARYCKSPRVTRINEVCFLFPSNYIAMLCVKYPLEEWKKWHGHSEERSIILVWRESRQVRWKWANPQKMSLLSGIWDWVVTEDQASRWRSMFNVKEVWRTIVWVGLKDWVSVFRAKSQVTNNVWVRALARQKDVLETEQKMRNSKIS